MCEQYFLKVQCVTEKLLTSFNLKKAFFKKICVVVKSAVGQ